jgi:hypothetical protein
MTFEEWQTARQSLSLADGRGAVENRFGYVPDDVIGVYTYDPGMPVALKDGQYFAHIGREEYTGTLAAVERKLWDEYAKHEVGDAGS